MYNTLLRLAQQLVVEWKRGDLSLPEAQALKKQEEKQKDIPVLRRYAVLNFGTESPAMEAYLTEGDLGSREAAHADKLFNEHRELLFSHARAEVAAKARFSLLEANLEADLKDPIIAEYAELVILEEQTAAMLASAESDLLAEVKRTHEECKAKLELYKKRIPADKQNVVEYAIAKQRLSDLDQSSELDQRERAEQSHDLRTKMVECWQNILLKDSEYQSLLKAAAEYDKQISEIFTKKSLKIINGQETEFEDKETELVSYLKDRAKAVVESGSDAHPLFASPEATAFCKGFKNKTLDTPPTFWNTLLPRLVNPLVLVTGLANGLTTTYLDPWSKINRDGSAKSNALMALSSPLYLWNIVPAICNPWKTINQLGGTGPVGKVLKVITAPLYLIRGATFVAGKVADGITYTVAHPMKTPGLIRDSVKGAIDWLKSKIGKSSDVEPSLRSTSRSLASRSKSDYGSTLTAERRLHIDVVAAADPAARRKVTAVQPAQNAKTHSAVAVGSPSVPQTPRGEEEKEREREGEGEGGAEKVRRAKH